MEENQPNNINILSRSDQRHDHELPQHILEEIIVRLPVKSIVRFKSVCKEWFNMISDLDLAEINFQQSISKLMILYMIMNARTIEYCSFKLAEKGKKARKVATLRLPDPDGFFPKYFSCNSLLLFPGEAYGGKLYVYDTIKQEQILLPETCLLHDEAENCCYSLVFDESKRKYKVVVFAHHNQGMKLFLYDLNPRNGWRKEKWRTFDPPFAQIIREHSSIAIQGVLYWIAQPAADPYEVVFFLDNHFIQPMEIATEKFMERIEVPCPPDEWFERPYSLFEMKRSLCLAHENSGGDEIGVWVLKDSARSLWIKQYNIALFSPVFEPFYSAGAFFGWFHPRLIVESYVLATIGRALFWYNMDTEELTQITVESDSFHDPCLCWIMN